MSHVYHTKMSRACYSTIFHVHYSKMFHARDSKILRKILKELLHINDSYYKKIAASSYKTFKITLRNTNY